MKTVSGMTGGRAVTILEHRCIFKQFAVQFKQPMLVLKRIDTGEIVGPFAPFLPVTRVVYANATPDGWVEVNSPEPK